MNRPLIIFSMVLGCTACQRQQSLPQNNMQAGNAAGSAPPTTETIGPGEPAGQPDDRAPVAVGPIDPKSAEGAGQVMRKFGELLEQREFADAYLLWWDEGRASEMSKAAFIAAYDRLAEIHSEVGEPGPMEGAAGSAYVELPFRLYGRSKHGKPFNQTGTIILRRANDIPGSTEAQRRWQLYQARLQPPL